MTKSKWAALVVAGWAAIVAIGGAAAPQEKAPGDELPPGPGKVILDRACTSCHGLNEVTKFKDYWDRKQWQDAVGTMIAYGAEVDENEAKVLTDYLVQQLGRREK